MIGATDILWVNRRWRRSGGFTFIELVVDAAYSQFDMTRPVSAASEVTDALADRRRVCGRLAPDRLAQGHEPGQG